MKTNLLLLEDDILYAWELEQMLNELEEYHIVATYSTAKEAIDFLNEDSIDIALVDIRLKGEMNGIEFAKYVLTKGIPVVLMTQFDDMKVYQDALSLSKHSFLIKPFHKFTLDSTIRLLLPFSEIDTKNNLIYIRIGNKREILSPDSIIWIEAKRNYCTIKTNDGMQYTVKRSLRNMYEHLPNDEFIFVHKSFLVKLNKIKRFDLKSKIVIVGDSVLPLGRSYFKQLKNLFLQIG